MALSTDICRFDTIYNSNFNYCVPQKVVEGFLNGTAFGRTEPYTSEEKSRLIEDINEIYNQQVSAHILDERVAVFTAGAPGAGKTTVMRSYVHSRPFSYVDPDDVCLKSMRSTWEKDSADPLAAYDKWRPGSNAAAHLMLANLIRDGKGFYFGTTSSSPLTANTFAYLKEKGYKIHVIHVIAPDEERWKSIKERDKTFVQTTEQDVIEKGELVPQRINDTFLRFADTIEFYHRERFDSNAVLTATVERKEDQLGLAVHDQPMYEEMIKVHNTVCERIKDGDQYRWENSVLKAVR